MYVDVYLSEVACARDGTRNVLGDLEADDVQQLFANGTVAVSERVVL